MWLNAIAHVQVTYSPEVEDAMLFFYSNILGLTEIEKPEPINANGGAWYILGDIQVHLSIENNPSNATSRRHICYLVRSLEAFKQHLHKHGVEIIDDQNIMNRFFLRDPAGNRIEIASSEVF